MSCGCGPCSGGKCLVCKIVAIVLGILGVLGALAALMGVYHAHTVTGGWVFGTPEDSFALAAFGLFIFILFKAAKACPCRMKACGSGCGGGSCDCGSGGMCPGCGKSPCVCNK